MPKLILSGGNAFHLSKNADGLADCLAELCDGPVGVITYAIESRYKPERHFEQVSAALKAAHRKCIHVAGKQDLDGLAGLFLMGGHPDTLLAELSARDMIQPIYDQWVNGMVLGGDSAGAMVMFEQMMAPGARMSGSTELVPALGYVKGAIVAVHWNSADPAWKLRFKNAHETDGIVAIDESTSLVWDDGNERTIGVGQVQKLGPAKIFL